MPIYQYKCNHCKEEYEIKMSMDEVGKKKPKCPKCKKAMERIFSFHSQSQKCSTCIGGTCPLCK